MCALRLQVVIPFHQPLCANDDAIEDVYRQCYEPLLDHIEAQKNLRVSLHFSGQVLDFLSRKKPAFLSRVKQLAGEGRTEILGGLFYGGIPALLPELDIRGQIQMTAEFWESCIGQAPTGFWLNDLAFAPELPRLMDETGLNFGFISSNLVPTQNGQPEVGTYERGGLSLALFVLSAHLSSKLPDVEIGTWLRDLTTACAERPNGLVSIWLKAEALADKLNEKLNESNQTWLKLWFEAIAGAEIETVLPSESLNNTRPVTTLSTLPGIAPELNPLGVGPKPVEWIDFPHQFVAIDTFYRKLLHVSDKLRQAIANMEEDGLEEEWSDSLATAQRLVFSAEAGECFWRGLAPGFSDPKNRDAAFSRLSQAEAMLDALVQGEDDWIATEEEDRDLDLVDEVFVANKHLSAWIVPALFGSVRILDDRLSNRNLLDVNTSLSEPFPSDTNPSIKQNSDFAHPTYDRRGIHDWLLPTTAKPADFINGTCQAIPVEKAKTEILQNGIDESGDAAYLLKLSGTLDLEGQLSTPLKLEKTLSVPIDKAELQLSYDFSPDASTRPTDFKLAIEIPLRLGLSRPQIEADNIPIDYAENIFTDARHISFRGETGTQALLEFSPGLEIWLLPAQAFLPDPTKTQNSEQGLILMAVIDLNQLPPCPVTLRLTLLTTT